MNFDEWWKQTKPAECDELKEWFDEAWRFAFAEGYRKGVSAFHEAVELERKECAKLAAAHFIYGHSVAGPHFAAALADKIRMRSNAELRGGPAALPPSSGD